MSSSLLLNPATGKLFGEYLPTSISIPTDQLSSPTTLGVSVSMIDGGNAQFLVAPANPAADDASIRVGDSLVAGSSVLRWNGIEYQVENTGSTIPFADFDTTAGPYQGTATLSNIRLLNGLPVPSQSAVSTTLPLQNWVAPIGKADVATISVPVYAAVGQKILITLTTSFRISPTAPFVGSDGQLTLGLQAEAGSFPFPIPAPSYTATHLLGYIDGSATAQSYTETFQFIVVSTGESAWTITLSAASPAHSYNATFQDPVVLSATALQN